MHIRLTTEDRMLSWNVNVNPTCVLCLESRNHLFFSCNFSAKIWLALTKGLIRRNFSNWPNIVSTIYYSAANHALSCEVRVPSNDPLHLHLEGTILSKTWRATDLLSPTQLTHRQAGSQSHLLDQAGRCKI
uniref:Reverse transcriptase zinc-binding domain-containing protein n=1 Tax=Noccaea caerulescens TaxID=107243 RepID=A0A1J3GYI7_NOCCA